jgi:TIR domain
LSVPTILISYRREDTAAYAGRLADRLKAHFGRDKVFVDVDTIQPGEDFLEVIDQSLRSSSVVVALIGREWLNAADASGRRRLDRSDDFVRTEIAKALASRVRVIPALVGNALMPEAKDLPEDLQPLTRRQAIEISDTRFHQDVDRLIQALTDTPAVRPAPLAPSPAPPAERRPANNSTRWLLIAGAIVILLVAAAEIWRFTRGDPGVGPQTSGAAPPGAPGGSLDSAAERAGADSGSTAGGGSTPGTAREGSTSPGSGTALKTNSDGTLVEVEPNTDILHPNVLPLGTTVRAAIRPVVDKDFFRIRTPAGASEMRVVLTNRSKLRPTITVWDSTLTSVKSEHNVFGDLYFDFQVEPSADYIVECAFIRVNQNFADPEDSGAYELTVLRVK